ncbi:TatD family hydrolase [Persicobacter diffluens]
MQLIDTHAHIYLEQFKEDRKEMIAAAKAAGIGRIYMPNIDVASIASMMELQQEYPDYCFPMMGLHPCDVKEDYKAQLETMRAWFDRFPFAAVGEIGTDLYWDKTTLDIQLEALRIQIGWAKELDLPVVLHCRDSFTETIEVVEAEQDGRLRGVFHCFTGSIADAQRAIDCGFMLGMGGVSTFKNGGMDKVIPSLDLQHLILETDAPYLAPVPHRGKRNEPAYVRLVADRVAELQSIPVEEVAEITTENAMRLFRAPNL